MTSEGIRGTAEIMRMQTGKWVIFATVLASSMAFIDLTALNVVRPTIQEDLGASGSQLLWIDNAYLVMLAALILVGGSLGDHFGRKRVFMVGITGFMVASVICGLSPSANVLIAGRAVQGIGGALLVPGSLAIIAAFFAADVRGKAIGTWSSMTTLATIAGPILGGVLANAGLWRGVFFINVPLGVSALAILYFKVPESRDESASQELDYWGALLVTLGLAGMSYGLIQAPQDGFDDPLVLAGLIGGVAALTGFVLVEAFSKHPMVSLSYFKSRTFSGANLLTLFLYGALTAALLFLPLNLVQVQGYAENEVGLVFLPFTISLILLSRWAGGLVDRYGPRLPLTIGPAIVGVGFFTMTLPGITGGFGDFWTTFFPPMLIMGLGMGVTVAPLTTAVMGSVSSAHSGVASGVNNAVSRVAGVLAIAIMGALALLVFRDAVIADTVALSLPDEARLELEQETENLFGAAVPESLPAESAAQVQTAIRGASVETFRLVFYIAAGMAAFSALLAALLVESRMKPVDVEAEKHSTP